MTLALARIEALERAASINGEPAADMRLVRTVFADLPVRRDPAGTDDVTEFRDVLPARTGAPKPLDLVFFEAPGFGPRVGIVRSVADDGTAEAAFVTRAAVRTIRFRLDDPHTRRIGRRVINSFIRKKSRRDPRGTAYLAGALFESVRTLVD